jgi:protein TonB
MFKKALQLLSVSVVLVTISLTPVLASGGLLVIQNDSTTVYEVVDEMPEVEGGIKEIYRHIEYPRAAVSGKVEGRVFVKFIIDEKGKVRSPEIIKDIGAGCGQAAIDGIKKLKFTPGKLQGKPVKVYYTLPVNFKIQGH